MHPLQVVLLTAIFVVTLSQGKTLKPVVLPELSPPIKITQTQSVPLAVPTPTPFRVKELSAFAVFNNTVYFKVGEMVVPLIGTTGCFTPKEVLKTGDPRLHFERELPVPPSPPEPAAKR